MLACGMIFVARCATSSMRTQALAVFSPAMRQCRKLSFMAFCRAVDSTRARTPSFRRTAILPRKMVALVRMDASASFWRLLMARTSRSCSCVSSSLSTMKMRLMSVLSRSLALESAKPAITLSNTLLFTTAAGISGTRGFRDCSMTVRTVRSPMDHSCTRMGTQFWRNTASSSLFKLARRHSRFTDTCTDCLHASRASLRGKSLIAICRVRHRLGSILWAQTALDRPTNLGSSLLTTSRNSFGVFRLSSPMLSMNCRCSELNIAH
mmetsp:Transcript_10723/g.17492  ORF Transcript_10723/g.17492 Transcript_10723/m.17492 type:complete len:265 (-) Transcript_10723:825-1619(-)